MSRRSRIRSTTILAVRRADNVVLVSDGQVTLDTAKVKARAKKVRRLAEGSVLAGFAGGAADAFALLNRFEEKLAAHQNQLERAAVELVRDWRTDRMLRRLEAMLVVADAKRTFVLSGTGDLIEPDDGVVAIGSGSVAALAAARALVAHTDLPAREVATHALRIAAEIDIYTNDELTIEEIWSTMVFYMPGDIESSSTSRAELEDMTPRQVVAELDRFIVGQADAKRAVAIALRNRMRRKKLSAEMAEEVLPKNILMIGPTGVGKTEIARRLARLAGSPFLKVEASKFTEVGYVGRDVESMVRDLVEVGIDMARQERREQVRDQAALAANQRLLDVLLPPRPRSAAAGIDGDARARESDEQSSWQRSRATLERQLAAGELEQREVEVETTAAAGSPMRIFSPGGMEELDLNLREMLPNLFQGKPRRRKMTVAEAREAFIREEEEKLIDPEQLARQAIRRVEESGILFVDELDKVAGREGGHGPDISREGVQRDLLPIVEGTLVNTKHGMVRTDHILFIAAGAFHVSKPSDLIPELQGRFPIRVELEALGRAELVRILTEPESSLVRQYEALLATEGVELEFTADGVDAIAAAAAEVNARTENIGARRLHTVMERLLDEVSFAGPELAGQHVRIDEAYVNQRLEQIASDSDLSRFIL